ncbi:Replication factor A protein 1 [Onygenales sp. PD_40]|nr:Replication factor A protein 1 [Onygenales sp. PD_40]KAK2782155.1 Replication factor A protein 1 [Emmonsiellopsis sp. PD_33]KAK2785991.1 Replication factor A protein 1 [Onygenales sp. PD_10]KAK2790870.1 Replication factor A protein 1 [Onygenales sp. PD_12]
MADPASEITLGALSAIFDDSKPNVAEPVVQCVQVKPLPAQPNGPERFRAVFSDISNYVQTMLATQANHFVTSGQLVRGCFVRLKSFQANLVKGKRILIILDLEVIERLGVCEKKIGDPQPLEQKAEDQEKTLPTTISSNGFYGARPQPQAAPQQPQRTPAASSAHANIYPIEALSPYSHKWTIKARCTNKSAIKTWHNKNGEGKLFSVNLLDESGEIRATAFKDQCDMLYDVFEEGSVYYISSPCRVQMAKKQFTNLNNDYELTFEKDTLVEKAEEQNDVPQVRFNFTNIGNLQSVEPGTTIDVLGVLKDVGETSQLLSKATSKPYDKRDLTLVDNTGYSVRLTVWGNTATDFDTMPESVIAFKGVKVSDFRGRTLSLLSSGSMTVDPDIEDAHKLKGWYDAQGRSETFASHDSMGGAMGSSEGRSNAFKTLAQVHEENLGMSEKPDYFSLKATVVFVRQETMSYPACPTEKCNKKVLQDDSGLWRCERCNQEFPKPEYRYILSVHVCDHTGAEWLSCFDEVGKLLLGTTADHLQELKETDEKAVGELVQEANCRVWNFNCRAKMDTFQEQQRVRYQVLSVSPVDYTTEATRLTELIKSYNID